MTELISQTEAARVAAERLGRPVAPATVRSWVARGRVKTAATELGRAPIVRASLEEYLRGRASDSATAGTRTGEGGSQTVTEP